MSNSNIQRSFASGEIAPSLHSRVDQSRYATGLKTLRNAFVMRHGGAANRPGSIYSCEVKDSTKEVYLVPFIFSNTQTYMLEFGDLYIRVIKDGAQVTDLTGTITAATQANPGVLTCASHGLSVGNEISISNVLGMTQLNGRNYKVGTVPNANTFTLTYMDGTTVNTTAFGAYTSGGTFNRIYTITSTYLEADLADIKYSQSGDVITLVHPSYPVRELTRTSDSVWAIADATFAPDFSTGDYSFLTGSAGAAGAVVNKYVVTAVSNETGEESLPMYKDYGALASVPEITAITQAYPAVVTQAAHGYSNNDLVIMRIGPSMGMNDLRGMICKVANATANNYELEGIDTTGYDAFTWSVVSSPNKSRALPISLTITSAAPTAAAPNVLDWQVATPFTREYNIYKELNGAYGLIGISKNLTYNDIGLTPDTSNLAPNAFNPFPSTDNYPSTVAYIQQRLAFGNTNNNPETVYKSKIGNYKNFTKNIPVQDDDYVEFKMAGTRVNRVKHILDVGRAIIMTDAGEWTAEGNQNGAVTPSEINLKQHSYNGCSSLKPLVVGGNAIYVQARGSVVRDLAFDYQIDGYRGNDLTSFSSHLVDKYSIVDWDYQQVPHSIVWMVRNDGVLLGLTHVREQQLLGWSRHDFGDDIVEGVRVIPNGTEDEVYLVIKRTIGGATKRYIERFASRQVIDVIDNVFMDSALTYDGRNTGSTTMTLSGGTTWSDTETLTLTASASYFTALDVGNEIHFYDASDRTLIRFSIEGYTSATVVTGKSNVEVPAALRAIASLTYARAIDEITELWHLEGKDLSIIGDKFVIASPNNEAYPIKTVANGAVSLGRCYAVIHAGLPYITDIETLDVDTPQGETLSNKKKLTSHITGRFEETRGVFIGPKPPSDDDTDPLENLIDLKMREAESLNDPTELLTGVADLNVQAHWNNHGRVFFRQVDPLPMSLLSVVGEGLFPFKGGS